jgi:hypothetical protein
MVSLLKVIVGRPAVVNHHARIVCTDKALGYSTRASRVDDVGGRLGAYQRMQPGTQAADMTASFVGDDPRRLPDALTDRVVNRLAAPCRSQDGVDTASRRQGDAEQARQDAADLAVRQARLLVQLDDRGLSGRPSCEAAAPKASEVCKG